MSHDQPTHFSIAFNKTMQHEDGYSWHDLDPGGETYMGISRVYWPRWTGWAIIDDGFIENSDIKKYLREMVRDFYRENFWYRFQGDQVAAIAPDIAYELFDTGVNIGVSSAVEYFQEALNLLNRNQKWYDDIIVDGLLGSVTIHALQRCIDTFKAPKEKAIATIVKLMNIQQGHHYITQMQRFPQKEIFRGWFGRV